MPLPRTSILRFAPSPTGRLHLGNGYSALYCFRMAQHLSGRFLLRVEDIDKSRCQPEYETGILEDLAWLGLNWEEPIRRQSEHMQDYASALKKLTEAGLTYPCFCTRKQISEEVKSSPSAPHGPDGFLYPGTCRQLSAIECQEKISSGASYAIRLDSELASRRVGSDLFWIDRRQGRQSMQGTLHGDAVLARKGTTTSYHLAVTVDDAIQGVTLVTRGKDLFAASHLHRLLQALLNLPTPEYDHHPLLEDDNGVRMAKRKGTVSLAQLRLEGHDPEELYRLLDFPF